MTVCTSSLDKALIIVVLPLLSNPRISSLACICPKIAQSAGVLAPRLLFRDGKEAIPCLFWRTALSCKIVQFHGIASKHKEATLLHLATADTDNAGTGSANLVSALTKLPEQA